MPVFRNSTAVTTAMFSFTPRLPQANPQEYNVCLLTAVRRRFDERDLDGGIAGRSLCTFKYCVAP